MCAQIILISIYPMRPMLPLFLISLVTPGGESYGFDVRKEDVDAHAAWIKAFAVGMQRNLEDVAAAASPSPRRRHVGFLLHDLRLPTQHMQPRRSYAKSFRGAS